MGAALYKVDFLYPKRVNPDMNEDGPYLFDEIHMMAGQMPNKQIKQKDEEKKQPPKRVERELVYKSTYDDYSDCSQITDQAGQTSSNNFSKNRVEQLMEVQRKILLLPASEQGPILLSIHKTEDELKVKSNLHVTSNISSRKSSEISLNSHESKTILVKKTLQPSIREILADTPSKGECFAFMEKGKQAWKMQSYEKCIEYLTKGLQACLIQHPANIYEKGIYHRRLGANYRMLYHDQQALKHFREALKYFQMQPDAQIIEIAAVLNNIGIIYQQENKPEIALDHFLRSLQLKRQFLPEHHEELAMRLNNIALLQWTLGDKKKAVDSYAQALHINKIVYGYNHHEVAKNYYDLSLCLFGIGEYGLWLDYHYQSLKIMKKMDLAQSADYKTWMNCFKIRMREFLALQNHQHQLVVKSLGMMTLILDKDDQISFLTEIKDDLEKI